MLSFKHQLFGQRGANESIAASDEVAAQVPILNNVDSLVNLGRRGAMEPDRTLNSGWEQGAQSGTYLPARRTGERKRHSVRSNAINKSGLSDGAVLRPSPAKKIGGLPNRPGLCLEVAPTTKSCDGNIEGRLRL